MITLNPPMTTLPLLRVFLMAGMKLFGGLLSACTKHRRGPVTAFCLSGHAFLIAELLCSMLLYKPAEEIDFVKELSLQAIQRCRL